MPGLLPAQDDLAAASLTAPFTGVVASVGLAVGDAVGSTSGPSTAGSASSTTSTAITVITTNAWIVDATVGSADLAQLKKGLQAEITPSGATTKVFGTISSVGIIATSSSSGSATFPVVIAVTGNPTGLYAGATADVTLIVKQVPNVLTVPTLALHTVGSRTVVYQKVGGKQVTTPVIIGTSYGATTQITSGLREGNQVVVTFARPGGAGTRRSGTTGSNQQRNFGTPGGFTGGGFPGGNG